MLCVRWLLGLCLALVVSGCASTHPGSAAPERRFQFGHDTLAYANELVWEYQFDPETGKTHTHRREPPPTYKLHCFVVARSARQFFYHARFEPALARPDAQTMRRIVRQILDRDSREPSKPDDKVVVPGYADLQELSKAHEGLLKSECGGAWRSYFQRGQWRILFPFSAAHQRRVAELLNSELAENRVAVVHVICFPSLRINHALLLYAARENASGIEFDVYDPNDPHKPTRITFDRGTGRFELPRNPYFVGGRVDLYEIYPPRRR